jgi:hypothetical protein
MEEPISVLKGKVIKILDNFRVVVDIGYDQGITKDMKFFIYEYGDEIRDPTTNEIIDRIERIKHRIKVIHIQEKFSIMRSDEYYRPFSKFFLFPGSSAAYDILPLTTDINSIKSPQKVSKLIKIGDLVRQDVN